MNPEPLLTQPKLFPSGDRSHLTTERRVYKVDALDVDHEPQPQRTREGECDESIHDARYERG